MENYITSVSYSTNPYEMTTDRNISLRIKLDHSGETLFDLAAAVPDGNWATRGRESAFVTMMVDGEYNQDLILFYGEECFVYQRLLGYLNAGEHEITLVFNDERSSSQIHGILIYKMEIRQVQDSDPEALFYKHTPLLYGRNLNDPFESTYSDTPLLMFYYCDEHDNLTSTLEYHIIFSHEDGGTDAPALMSKWGRTTDMEWVYRVKIDAEGEMIEGEGGIEEFQGPEHVTTRFTGTRALGVHPVLQAATINGNVTDQPSSDYRYLLPPAVRLPREVNREAVMNLHPWTYQVMAKEMQRQEMLEQPADPGTTRLADQRNYLFLQISRQSFHGNHQIGRVDIKVKLWDDEKWYTSIHEIKELAYESVDGPFSTTVKMPEGTVIGDIQEIAASYLFIEEAPQDYRIEVPGIRAAFFLDETYMPIRPMITSRTKAVLSPANPQATLWNSTRRSCME